MPGFHHPRLSFAIMVPAASHHCYVPTPKTRCAIAIFGVPLAKRCKFGKCYSNEGFARSIDVRMYLCVSPRYAQDTQRYIRDMVDELFTRARAQTACSRHNISWVAIYCLRLSINPVNERTSPMVIYLLPADSFLVYG